jgi:hypothetical protein
MTNPTNDDDPKDRGRLNWSHISTVISAGVLIGTEVFGAAYAAGWALAELLGLDYYLGPYGIYLLQVIFCGGGVYVMVWFFRIAFGVEPIIRRE